MHYTDIFKLKWTDTLPRYVIRGKMMTGKQLNIRGIVVNLYAIF